jgi:hypothetical protein
MQTFHHYNIYWNVYWNIDNDNKPYASNKDNYTLSHEAENLTLKEISIKLKRKPTAIASKLRSLKILNFDKSIQKNWDVIYECLDTHTISKLQEQLIVEQPSTKELQKSGYISGSEIFDNKHTCKISKKLPMFDDPIRNNNPQKETIMNRRTVIVELFDDNKGLDVKHSRVFSKEVVTESDSDNSIIQQMLLEAGSDSVSDAIKAHNKLRSETVDENILQNTGNEVMLREVKIEDLRWSIR